MLEAWKGSVVEVNEHNAAALVAVVDALGPDVLRGTPHFRRQVCSASTRGDRVNRLPTRDAGDLRRDESAFNSIVTTWQITFEQIRRDRPSAANLLSFMNFFNPQGIPESVLRAYIRDQLEGGEDDFEEDLEVLRGYSLVAVTTDSDVFQMHALVQFCTRLWLSSDEMQRWKRVFLRAMADQYPTGDYENWVKC